MGGTDFIRYTKIKDRVAIDAEIRSQDKQLVASIHHNEFTVNPSNYFAIARPDRSTLVVTGKDPEDFLIVQYIRSDTVKVSASLRLESGQRFRINDEGFTLDNLPFFRFTHVCFTDSSYFALNAPRSLP